MPHCVLEISSNVLDQPDPRKLLSGIHDRLVEAGGIERDRIKSRIVRRDEFLIGDGDAERAFVALDVGLLDGRDDETKARISESLLELLEREFPDTVAAGRSSVTVQISDIHRASYRKAG